MYYLDDPIGDFSIFPTFLVSRLAREHVTVALSGDGADEIFGGYETYVAQQLWSGYSKIPAPVRHRVIEPVLERIRPTAAKKGIINKAKRFIEGARLPESLQHCRWRMFLDSDGLNRLLSGDARSAIDRPPHAHIENLFDRAGDRSAVDRGLYVDVKSYLCDNILTKVDRMSMAVSLEARVPYLDKDLVELAFRIPHELKVKGKETKILLKEVAARRVPSRCVYRQKEGFSIPIKNWLRGQFRPLLEELLSYRRIREAGLFDPSVVHTLKDEHLSGKANHSHILWSLIVFEAWRDKWLTSAAA